MQAVNWLLVLLLALLLSGCFRPTMVPPPEPDVPPRSLFEFHAATCPRCGGPPINPDGTENTLCEKGFELLQEDLRKEQK